MFIVDDQALVVFISLVLKLWMAWQGSGLFGAIQLVRPRIGFARDTSDYENDNDNSNNDTKNDNNEHDNENCNNDKLFYQPRLNKPNYELHGIAACNHPINNNNALRKIKQGPNR